SRSRKPRRSRAAATAAATRATCASIIAKGICSSRRTVRSQATRRRRRNGSRDGAFRGCGLLVSARHGQACPGPGCRSAPAGLRIRRDAFDAPEARALGFGDSVVVFPEPRIDLAAREQAVFAELQRQQALVGLAGLVEAGAVAEPEAPGARRVAP